MIKKMHASQWGRHSTALAVGLLIAVPCVSLADTATSTQNTVNLQQLYSQVAALEAQIKALSSLPAKQSPVPAASGIASGTVVFTRFMGPGTTGGDVTTLQSYLQGQGYLANAPTGYYGGKTKSAVIKFQAANSLATVGTVGPKTRAVLNQLLSSTSTASIPTSAQTSTNQSNPSISGGGTSASVISSGSGGGGVSSVSVTTTTSNSSSGGIGVFASTSQTQISTTTQSTSSQTSSTQSTGSTQTSVTSNNESSVISGGLQVYPGCAAPKSTYGHVWYIDPINGTSTGDGSQAHPWGSFDAVTNLVPGYTSPLLSTVPYSHRDAVTKKIVSTPNSDAPIKPGDEVLLMGGNYGSVKVGVYGAVIDNPEFVTVAAAPGQHPVFGSLTIKNTNHWYFKGIKVQSVKGGAYTLSGAIFEVTDQGSTMPTHDIVVDGLDVSNVDNADTVWTTQAAMVAQSTGLFLIRGSRHGTATDSTTDTSCVSVINSHFHNGSGGGGVTADNTLFANNEIDHIGPDALDYAANNLIISKNYIHDMIDRGDGTHPDAMQGQIGDKVPGVVSMNYHNILIDSNTIIRHTDPNLPFPDGMQGIDAFDMDWTNVTVSNNVVITDAYHGISYSSLHGGSIVNNTVLNDDQTTNKSTWIMIGGSTHEGSTSTGPIVVRNNITGTLNVSFPEFAKFDHNIAGLQLNSPDDKGVFQYRHAPYTSAGSYSGNILDYNLNNEFVNFDPAHYRFDVHLKSGATAIAEGSSVGAPSVDIAGAARTAPFDAGAYIYSGSKAPVSVTLAGSPASVVTGQWVTLTWNSVNASSCVGSGFTASGVSGSVSIVPVSGKLYSIACLGAGGSASANTIFAVTPKTSVSTSTSTTSSTSSTTTTSTGSASATTTKTSTSNPTTSSSTAPSTPGTTSSTPSTGVTGTTTTSPTGGTTTTGSTGTVSGTTGPGTTSTTDGTVLHVTLDKSTILGTTVSDSSGHGNNGTLVGSPTSVVGQIGDALAFDGSTQGVNLGNVTYSKLAVSNNAMTISAWVRPSNLTSPNQIIFAKGADASAAANESFVLYLNKYTSRPVVDFSDGNNFLRLGASSGPVNTVGTWELVTATLNGTTATIYINGQSAGTMASSTFGALTEAGGRTMSVGYDSAATRSYLSGAIDDVRLYNRALSPSEVGQLYAGTLALHSANNQVAAAANAAPESLSSIQSTLQLVLNLLNGMH